MPQGAVETPFFSGARTHGPMRPPKSKKNNFKKAKSPLVRLKVNRWQHLYIALLDKVKFNSEINVSRNPSLLGPEISLRYLVKLMKINTTPLLCITPGLGT